MKHCALLKKLGKLSLNKDTESIISTSQHVLIECLLYVQQ